ncbi:MAG: prepilin-type N-terminal cleavage/methylation domain-containing protein [Fimbriimonadaceae bacterium]
MTQRHSRLRSAGFTLVELLTVMAITAVLLTLVILPVIQSFNLTREAEGFSEAQEKARRLVERISREISQSAGVLDPGPTRGQLAVEVPGRNGAAIPPVILEFATVDLVRPAAGDPTRGPSGAFVNPDTGREDPTLRAPKGQVVLPVTPGSTIVRYWIGLRDPFAPNGYNNPYDGLLMARNAQRDNLFVLYRAEVEPFVLRPGGFVLNDEFFEPDPTTIVNGVAQPLIHDPYFFLPGYDRTGAPITGAERAAKERRVAAWRNRATIQTEISRFDMIQAVYDKGTRRVTYDGDVPRILALIQFRPAALAGETASGMTATRLSEETEAREVQGPDVFETRYGAWSQAVVRLFPDGWSSGQPYTVGRRTSTPAGFREIVHLYDGTGGGDLVGGVPQFDATLYGLIVRNSLPYPFSNSIVPAGVADPANRARFRAFYADARGGRVTTSFSIEEVGETGVTSFRPDRNLPTTSTGDPFSPLNDPAPAALGTPAGTPSNAAYEINRSFNAIWQSQPGLRPNIHRFIDLRVRPQADGVTPSPLHPDPNIGFAQARIVAGSEVVIGPDQNPGPNYGLPVRYTRTTGNPGPNQYRINYTDLREPDYTALGLTPPPANYTPGDFMSAVFQPRFRAGYIQLNSDPNVPLPAGNIVVSYRFQFTGAGDTVTVNYDTRQLMTVLLTIRNYPQSTLPNPQTVTLQATATVRNVLR